MTPDLSSARSFRRSPIPLLLLLGAGALASPLAAAAGIQLSHADGYWATSAPPVQRGHAAVHVPDLDLLLAIVPAGPSAVEVWALPLEQADAWIRLSAGGGPVLGPGTTAVYDPMEHEVIVHGGQDSPVESWALELEPELAWRQIATPGQGPGARRDHAAVYDPRRGSVLLYGGRNEDGLLSDLWELDLRDTHPRWRQLPQHGLRPGAVAGHAAVHDPKGGRTLVFGGGDLEGESDVWALSFVGPGSGTARWTRIPLATGPGSSRTEHTLVRDPSNGRIYLHGGVDENGVAQRDLWQLDVGDDPAWSLLAPGGVVSPLHSEHVAVIDPGRNRMVVSGGVPPLPDRNETWVLTLDRLSGASRWDRFAPAAAQAAGTWDDRGVAIAGAFDTNRGRLVVMQSRLDPPSRTWFLGFEPNARWTRVFDPPTRSADFYYDAARDRIVLHGGFTTENNPVRSSGTWELSLGEGLLNGYRPVTIAPGPTPTPRTDHLVLHDPQRDRMLVFGGLVFQPGSCAIAVDAHLLAHAQTPPPWSPVSADPNPEGGPFAAGIYDEANDRFIIQGGLFGCRFPNHPSGSFWDGTWALPAANPSAWVRLASPTEAPGDVSDATYDPVDRRLVAVRAGGGSVGPVARPRDGGMAEARTPRPAAVDSRPGPGRVRVRPRAGSVRGRHPRGARALPLSRSRHGRPADRARQ